MGGEVRLDARGMTDLLRSPNGPVMRDLMVRATRVQAAARQLAPKQTGDLANSVVKRPATFAGKPAVLVGVDNHNRTGKDGTGPTVAELALMMEEGTEPHKIRPRNRKALYFYWKKAGRIVIVPKVAFPHLPSTVDKQGRLIIRKGYTQHPGTKAYRWLSRSLERVRG